MKQKKTLIIGITGQDDSNPLRVYEADVDGDGDIDVLSGQGSQFLL